MTAPEIPPGPLESAPRVDAPPGQTMAAARDAWRHALRGLPMGAYDLRIALWLEDIADQPTLLTLASLLERARRAGESP